jgi:FlaG/FlaF family flagellin (archaellin)
MVGDRIPFGDIAAAQGFREDTTGVSQVIGIVLLVAITVTMAGIVAASLFVFNEQAENPSPSFTTETQFDDEMTGDGQSLMIEHVSGDSIDTDDLEIIVRDAKTDSGTEVEYVGNVLSNQLSGKFTGGKQITLDQRHFQDSSGNRLDSISGTYLNLEDATVLITWEDPSPGSDLTATLYECHVEFPNCEQSP